MLVLHNERSKLNSASDQDASLKPPSWGSEERFCLLACLETPPCPPEELEAKAFCLISKPLVNLAMCLSAKGLREGSWCICATQTWIRKWKDKWRKQKLWLKRVFHLQVHHFNRDGKSASDWYLPLCCLWWRQQSPWQPDMHHHHHLRTKTAAVGHCPQQHQGTHTLCPAYKCASKNLTHLTEVHTAGQLKQYLPLVRRTS